MEQSDQEPLQLKEIPSTLRPRRFRAQGDTHESAFTDEIRRARASWYWVWFECLRLSEEYRHCCANNGKGRLRHMYMDFGDVTKQPFALWWQRTGRYLFAQRKPLPKVECYTHLNELTEIVSLRGKLMLEVPLNVRKSTVVRQINRFLKEAYEGRDVIPREQSVARRNLVKSKLRIATAKRILDLYDLRKRKPDLTLWQLGEAAGLELDLQARTIKDVAMTTQDERIRMTIAVSRYLKQARNLIWNATEGVFPSIKPIATVQT